MFNSLFFFINTIKPFKNYKKALKLNMNWIRYFHFSLTNIRVKKV